jgi:alpha-galactosidase
MVQSAGPGHWNDPDMLLIGNRGLSFSQEESQFCLWVIFAAPLYLSTEVGKLSERARNLLLNPEILSVHQDVLGAQGYLISDNPQGDLRIWAKPLEAGNFAILFQNLGNAFGPSEITLTPKMLGWETSIRARDLIERQNWVEETESLTVQVDVSSVKMFLVEKVATVELSEI